MQEDHWYFAVKSGLYEQKQVFYLNENYFNVNKKYHLYKNWI